MELSTEVLIACISSSKNHNPVRSPHGVMNYSEKNRTLPFVVFEKQHVQGLSQRTSAEYFCKVQFDIGGVIIRDISFDKTKLKSFLTADALYVIKTSFQNRVTQVISSLL